MSSSCTLGIDVAKETLEVASWPAKDQWHFPNTPQGHDQICKLVERLDCDLVVLEATGGLQEACAVHLRQSGHPVEVVNPRQARNFASATGRLEKTDRIDALGLAHFAQIVEPESVDVPDEVTRQLKARVRRREQLVEMRSAEKNRRKRASDPTTIASIDRSIEHLDQQIEALEATIRKLAMSDELAETFQILTSAPGIAGTTATQLMANLPELGDLNRKEVAKLGGLAPLCNDSGQWEGQRSCRGGRPRVRHTMYLAALVAIRWCEPIKAFYTRLRDRGKETKVALIAAARKLLTILNSMVKHGETFDAEKAMPNH